MGQVLCCCGALWGKCCVAVGHYGASVVLLWGTMGQVLWRLEWFNAELIGGRKPMPQTDS